MGVRPPNKLERLYFIDNLRWSMIILVLFVHASVTYGPIGSWIFRDSAGASEGSDIILTIFSVFSQAFFMGFLFFLAGYFLPASYLRKGRKKYIHDRMIRLGIPSLIFIFFLGPPLVYYLNHDYYLDIGWSYWDYYIRYVPDVPNWESGPLWFTLALLGFTIAFTLCISPSALAEPTRERRLRHSHLVFLALGMGGITYLVRIFQPIGTDVWNMQLCFFAQYIILFLFGIAAFKNNWLLRIDNKMARPWLVLVILLSFIAFPVMLASGAGPDGDLTVFEGRGTWQSLALSLWGETFAVAIIITLLALFHKRYNRQGLKTKFLSDNAYSVYVFHAPILVALAVLLTETGLPILLKFLLVASCGVIITYTLSGFLIRKLPILKDIL